MGRRVGCGGVSEGELLTGDGVTQGIVRIGDTVRRPVRPFTDEPGRILIRPLQWTPRLATNRRPSGGSGCPWLTVMRH